MSTSSRAGSNSRMSACGYCVAYLSMPTFIREWMIARNVCDSTSGRPPRSSFWCVTWPRAVRRLRVERHERVDAQQQVDAVIERDRRVQCLVERAVDVMLAVDLDRREQAGKRARRLDRPRYRHVVVTAACRTRSGSPVSRFVATMKSLRRKLAEIVRAPGCREQPSSGSRRSPDCRTSPVGNARASVANDSIMPSCSGSRRYWSDARAASAGNAVQAAAEFARARDAGRSRASALRPCHRR